MTKLTTASAPLIKTIFRLMFVFTIFSALKVAGQGIIIDHNSLNIDQIPLTVIYDIQQNIKWQYSGTSHSGQLLCGITQIEETNPVYNVEIGGEYYCCFANVYDPPFLPNIPDALCIYPGNCGYRISNTGYYKNPSCVQQTLNQNPTINISQWCWCSELDSYTEAQVQEYLDAVNLLEQQNPNVIFVYMTGNAQAGGAPGYNRHLRNNQIRQYCINNNKVLYDFADLDCWHDGEQSTYLYNGENIPIQHPAFDGIECHHTTYESTLQKGKAVWWMMAQLRGWQADGQSLNIKLFLQGNYTESGMSTNLNSQGLLPLNQPYNIPPLNYNGDETVQVIPGTSIAEWVLIELRDAATVQTATSNTIILQKAAFILSNGQIVDLDGSSNIQFNQVINQQLYIVIRHRNHLGIISAFPLSESNNVYQYDFSTGSEQAYGGSNSQIELSPGVWGMIGGDGNLDGVIDNVDKTFTWTNNTGEEGYYSGDFNLNGNVNNQDKNLIWVINFGKTSYIP